MSPCGGHFYVYVLVLSTLYSVCFYEKALALVFIRYEGFLRRAHTENFQDMANLGAFYKAGLDYVGRQIVVFVGKQFPASKLDLSKVRAPHYPLPPRVVLVLSVCLVCCRQWRISCM